MRNEILMVMLIAVAACSEKEPEVTKAEVEAAPIYHCLTKSYTGEPNFKDCYDTEDECATAEEEAEWLAKQVLPGGYVSSSRLVRGCFTSADDGQER